MAMLTAMSMAVTVSHLVGAVFRNVFAYMERAFFLLVWEYPTPRLT